MPCLSCQQYNTIKTKIPSRGPSSKRKAKKFGEVLEQDLTFFKYKGSMTIWSGIVDAFSRWLSLARLPVGKWQAYVHLNDFLTQEKIVVGEEIPDQPRVVYTDNGGEFVGGLYEGIFERYSQHIKHETGAPWTPQSQGIIKKMNRDVKRIANFEERAV